MSERKYVWAADRNNPDAVHAHCYVYEGPDLLPMCGYGWNRSDGTSFSILRGWHSARGDCRLCTKNVEANKPPVKNGFPHKTKWI